MNAPVTNVCAPIVLGVYGLFEKQELGYQAALTTMALTGLLAGLLLSLGARTTGKAI